MLYFLRNEFVSLLKGRIVLPNNQAVIFLA